MPSNLTDIPRVSEKYEMNSFNNASVRENAQYRANLKTMEILKNNESGDAILNFNPGFFGGVSASAQNPVELRDPYADILSK